MSEQELLDRLAKAEEEILRLRDFRHGYQSDQLAVLLKVEGLTARIEQLRADLILARADTANVANLVNGVVGDVAVLAESFRLYDRKMNTAWEITKPVVVTLLTVFAIWLAGTLLGLWKG